MNHYNPVSETLGFKPQASQDLTYRLVEGDFSLEPMRVISERTVTWGVWNVTFYLLGASHAVRFSRRRRQLTELLSCAGRPKDGLTVLEIDVGQAPSIVAKLRDLRVHFTLTPLPLTKVDSFAGQLDDEDWLEHAFPNRDIDEPSWTRLRWQVTAESVRLETLHTYPHEGICIHGVTSVSEVRRSRRESLNGK